MLLAVMAHYADDEHGIALNRAGFGGGSNSSVGWSIMSKTTNKFSPEVRERAVRLVLDNEAAGAHREHPARRSRGEILRCSGR
ncbi:hypothetical protein [Cereibacter sphaeroides]|uniref:hypothetical protein n=1 Tax=Cereibacter sphaeroides TaxID=1063 RepID=UPI000F530FF6|nr:hypothetical protein [Cereibacter sphaeroides]AZB71284.1 hypothetical protein EBL86_23300 [Cereibacter sphaeroides]